MKHFHFYSKKSYSISLVSLVLLLSFGCQKDLLKTEDNFEAQLNLKSAKTSNFIVMSKSETLPVGFEAQLSAYGQIVNSIPEIGMVTIKPTTSNFEIKVAKLTGVSAVVPDLKVKWLEPIQTTLANTESLNASASGVVDDYYFGYQWGMDAVNAPEAWDAGFTGHNARVFILDSGIDADNADLAPNLNTSLSTSFVPGEGYDIRPGDYFNHGTHVAGIIAAAKNHIGVVGVAPDAEIVAVKVLSEYTGSGYFSWINAGIVYAANHGADVINMSLGASFNKNGFYYDENNVLVKIPAVNIQNIIIAAQRAVNYAFRKGAVIVVSAGNDGMNADGDASYFRLPAELQNVISVSATAPNNWYNELMNGIIPTLDIPASYTNYGKSLVDVAAPGGDFDYLSESNPNGAFDMVLSTSSDGYYYFAAGTSMASPHVAGVAALIIGKNRGSMSPQEVTKQLLKTADIIGGNGVSAYYGNGRVNAFRAVTE